MENVRELSAQAAERARSYEQRFHGCAQCTLAGIQEALGVEDQVLFQAATGLAAGGGLTTDGACGAYNGAVLVMSSLFGRRRDHITDDRDAAYQGFALARRLHNRFMDRYGTLQCRAIQERVLGRAYDLWDAEDKDAFEEAGAHALHCPRVCGQAAGWAVELIGRELDRSGISLEEARSAFRERQGRRATVPDQTSTSSS